MQTQTQDFILILKNDYHHLEKSIKSFFKNYSRIIDFLHSLFDKIPMEVFVIFFLSLILLYILNGISNSTRKTNFIVSVVFSALLVVVLSERILHKNKVDVAFRSILMILTPGFLYYGVIVLVKKILTSFRLKKLAKPSEIEKALSDIQISYNHVSAQTHLLLTNPGHDTGELKEMLEALKYSSEGLLDLLNKKSEAKKTEQEPVNLE